MLARFGSQRPERRHTAFPLALGLISVRTAALGGHTAGSQLLYSSVRWGAVSGLSLRHAAALGGLTGRSERRLRPCPAWSSGYLFCGEGLGMGRPAYGLLRPNFAGAGEHDRPGPGSGVERAPDGGEAGDSLPSSQQVSSSIYSAPARRYAATARPTLRPGAQAPAPAASAPGSSLRLAAQAPAPAASAPGSSLRLAAQAPAPAA